VDRSDSSSSDDGWSTISRAKGANIRFGSANVPLISPMLSSSDPGAAQTTTPWPATVVGSNSFGSATEAKPNANEANHTRVVYKNLLDEETDPTLVDQPIDTESLQRPTVTASQLKSWINSQPVARATMVQQIKKHIATFQEQVKKKDAEVARLSQELRSRPQAPSETAPTTVVKTVSTSSQPTDDAIERIDSEGELFAVEKCIAQPTPPNVGSSTSMNLRAWQTVESTMFTGDGNSASLVTTTPQVLTVTDVSKASPERDSTATIQSAVRILSKSDKKGTRDQELAFLTLEMPRDRDGPATWEVYQAITLTPAFCKYSLEELRLADYLHDPRNISCTPIIEVASERSAVPQNRQITAGERLVGRARLQLLVMSHYSWKYR
jgi:hypothetical protein